MLSCAPGVHNVVKGNLYVAYSAKSSKCIIIDLIIIMSSVQFTSSAATTSIDSHTFFFQWNITNAKDYLSSKSAVSSPLFSPDLSLDKESTKWRLNINVSVPSIMQTSSPRFDLSVRSHRLNSPTYSRLFVKGLVAFKRKESDDFAKTFEEKTPEWVELGKDHFRKGYVPDALQQEFVHNDTICAYFKIKIYVMQKPIVHTPDPPKFDLSKVLNDARLKETFTDISLVCGSLEFKVHRVVLASQSAFFNTRFEERWQTQDKKVDMSDLSPSLLKAIISYVYTGEVASIDNISPDLFVAADKYQLPALKAVCEQSLVRTLKIDNAIRFLRLATTLNADVLQQHVLGFLVANHAIRSSKEWEELDKCDPLRVQILEAWASI